MGKQNEKVDNRLKKMVDDFLSKHPKAALINDESLSTISDLIEQISREGGDLEKKCILIIEDGSALKVPQWLEIVN